MLDFKVKVHFSKDYYKRELKPEVVAAFNSLSDARYYAEGISPQDGINECYSHVEVLDDDGVRYTFPTTKA